MRLTTVLGRDVGTRPRHHTTARFPCKEKFSPGLPPAVFRGTGKALGRGPPLAGRWPVPITDIFDRARNQRDSQLPCCCLNFSFGKHPLSDPFGVIPFHNTCSPVLSHRPDTAEKGPGHCSREEDRDSSLLPFGLIEPTNNLPPSL